MYDKKDGKGHSQRKKIGVYEIDLAKFYGQDNQVRTFKMDHLGNIFLTVSIYVGTEEQLE